MVAAMVFRFRNVSIFVRLKKTLCNVDLSEINDLNGEYTIYYDAVNSLY